MSKIFIVILNWNQPELTIDCVESLQKIKVDKNQEIKIVIVDNGSSDNSVALFRKLHPKKLSLEVMETNSNLGFAGGNNIGINYALHKNADYVMILNNDTIVDPNLLVSLTKNMDKDLKVGIAS